MSEPDELSEQDLNQLLHQHDPKFLEGLNEVAKNPDLNQVHLTQHDGFAEFLKEIHSIGGWRLKVLDRAPLVVKAYYWTNKFTWFLIRPVQRFFWEVKASWSAFRIRTLAWRPPKLSLKISFKNPWTSFSKKKKQTYIGLAGGLGLLGVYFYISLTRGILHPKNRPEILSIAEVADSVHTYKTNELVPFLDNPQAGPNTIWFPKVIANIRASRSSGGNPMAAFEFYFLGVDNDILVEIKAREVQLRDELLRLLENKTFDDLNTIEGRKRLCSEILNYLNGRLSNPRIRAVYIKTYVLKP